MRTTCRKPGCPHYVPGAPSYCDPHDEFIKQVKRENQARYVLMCAQCGEPLTIQHRYHHKYRDGEFPKGIRRRLR